MTALRTSRMDDSYVEEAERENGRPVSLIGVGPHEPRGRNVMGDDPLPRERLADLLPTAAAARHTTAASRIAGDGRGGAARRGRGIRLVRGSDCAKWPS